MRAPGGAARPTPRLALALLPGILPALLGLQSDLGLGLLLAWDLALLALFVVDVLLLPQRRALTAERQVALHLTHGRPASVRLLLSSQGDAARARVIDEPPRELVPPEPAERALPVRLVPGGEAQVEYTVRPRRRGVYRFGPVNVLASGPLGLAARRFVLPATGTQEVHVYSDLGQVEQTFLDPALLLAELGLRRVRRRAEGTELESLRDAVPEDELRRIDWRATARRGRPIAREYQLERNHEVLLCLDTGRLMGALLSSEDPADGVVETKLDQAVTGALLLAAVALKNGDRVGLLSFAEEPGAFVRPERGKAQLGRLLEATHTLRPSAAEPSFVKALAELGRRQKKRALLVVLTDFADPETAGLMLDVLGLLSRRHAILFVALKDPELGQLAHHPPQDLGGTYQSLAALSLLEGRARVLDGLGKRGVEALDLTPAQVSARAIQAYLALRSAARF